MQEYGPYTHARIYESYMQEYESYYMQEYESCFMTIVQQGHGQYDEELLAGLSARRLDCKIIILIVMTYFYPRKCTYI